MSNFSTSLTLSIATFDCTNLSINCAEFQRASRQRVAIAFLCHTGLLGGEMVFTQGECYCGLTSVHMYTQGRRAMWHCLLGQQSQDKTFGVIISMPTTAVALEGILFLLCTMLKTLGVTDLPLLPLASRQFATSKKTLLNLLHFPHSVSHKRYCSIRGHSIASPF